MLICTASRIASPSLNLSLHLAGLLLICLKLEDDFDVDWIYLFAPVILVQIAFIGSRVREHCPCCQSPLRSSLSFSHSFHDPYSSGVANSERTRSVSRGSRTRSDGAAAASERFLDPDATDERDAEFGTTPTGDGHYEIDSVLNPASADPNADSALRE